jgi:hypothetical protein
MSSKEIFSTWKNKTELKDKDIYSSEDKIGWNIYDPKLTNKQYKKRFDYFHLFFKYKFFVPLLKIAGKILNKIKTKIPEGYENKNLFVFDKAFEKSINEWINYFRKEVLIKSGQKVNKKILKNMYKDNSTKMLRICKDILIQSSLNDTTYKEFFNILMFNICLGINEEYKGSEEHLLYTEKSINDMRYYIIKNFKERGIKLEQVNGVFLK